MDDELPKPRNRRDPPDWPVTMRRATAARYLDMSAADLDREVAAGVLPQPFRLRRSLHWSREAIDRAIGQLTKDTEVEHDWRKDQPAYQREPEPDPAPTRAFTCKTLATRWGMSESQIWGLHSAGKVKAFRLGKLIRFTPAEVLEAEKRLGLV